MRAIGLESFLQKKLKGKVVIIGVGNTMRSDDGFGPTLIANIKGKVKAICIDAGSAPENYAGKIVKEKPDTILIIDAIHLGLKPGEYEILNRSDIAETGFTTHNISLNMFVEYLEKETNADIYILGVQPESVDFSDKMSENVKKTLEEISELIYDIDKS